MGQWRKRTGRSTPAKRISVMSITLCSASPGGGSTDVWGKTACFTGRTCFQVEEGYIPFSVSFEGIAVKGQSCRGGVRRATFFRLCRFQAGPWQLFVSPCPEGARRKRPPGKYRVWPDPDGAARACRAYSGIKGDDAEAAERVFCRGGRACFSARGGSAAVCWAVKAGDGWAGNACWAAKAAVRGDFCGKVCGMAGKACFRKEAFRQRRLH